MESSIEGTVDSSTENDSQNVEVLVEATVDVSTDIQIVESLEDQFFVLLDNWPNHLVQVRPSYFSKTILLQ